MNETAKLGTELISDFFKGLSERADLDKNVVKALCSLQANGKLTATQISNTLRELQEEKSDDNARTD